MIGRVVEVRIVTILICLVLTHRAWCLHAVAVCAGNPDPTLTDKRDKAKDSKLRAHRKAK